MSAQGKGKHSKAIKPFVSICTPTFNRRPFIESMIKCFKHQDYPKDRMEWIIIDDGTDKIEDLVSGIKQVKYFKYDKKMNLGEKRNLMHQKSKGQILVYMDDDDYYPPKRVSHAVEMLQSHPEALCAGSSEIYIYFKHIQKLYQFGPYGANHATAGTFAFKRKLLQDHKYDDDASLAEEKAFLKNYTVPFVQLDPLKTILVFSHDHNTFDKKKLLENLHPQYVKESEKTVEMFIKEADLRDFYMNRIEELLVNYSPGRPLMKPDVILQTLSIEERRRKEAEKNLKLMAENIPSVTLTNPNGTITKLNIEQVVELLRHLQSSVVQLTEQLKGKDFEIEMLKNMIKPQHGDISVSTTTPQVLSIIQEPEALSVQLALPEALSVQLALPEALSVPLSLPVGDTPTTDVVPTATEQ
jgi:glycosyltransferase involved in cell wall biosynthesis